VKKEFTMKTITLVVALLFSLALSSAGVLTVNKFTVVKNSSGSMSISFDLSAIPANAHIDLAMLSIDGGSLTLTDPVEFILRDANGQKIAHGGFGKTRQDMAGKQKARFLLTMALQAWVKGGEKQPQVNLDTRNTTGHPALSVVSAEGNVELIIYYTVPG
jgi:hypothetical protein